MIVSWLLSRSKRERLLAALCAVLALGFVADGLVNTWYVPRAQALESELIRLRGEVDRLERLRARNPESVARGHAVPQRPEPPSGTAPIPPSAVLSSLESIARGHVHLTEAIPLSSSTGEELDSGSAYSLQFLSEPDRVGTFLTALRTDLGVRIMDFHARVTQEALPVRCSITIALPRVQSHD